MKAGACQILFDVILVFEWLKLTEIVLAFIKFPTREYADERETNLKVEGCIDHERQ